MAKHRADGEPDGVSRAGDEESGLERAAESWAENLADQVNDGVQSSPRDTAEDGPDPQTETHSSLSEGSNSRDGRDDPSH
ncbi:hypothetical protein SAMN04488693_11131 [Arthrobacter subterraneus]|uniref:Uncharacterized protein n=1 Tax=Arthrobacter subterraneus TaxID=335973 RepID=A0A1G8KHD4_9MICC|nr:MULTISPECIES: hypothetical protein [Arthrobacter]SDI42826.1 hypothetical protein SAMN04488693_11131 [Arthrobacter subterraneus]